MRTKSIYKVTFRNSNDKLTSMFEETYTSVESAKIAIESDAAFFLNRHKYVGDITGTRIRQQRHWKNPKTEDYYEVRGQDGCSCIWQYFKV